MSSEHQPPQQRERRGNRFQAELARLWDGFRTADGRTMSVLSPDERVMVVLSRPERVTGADRAQLGRLLADRYTAGATLPGLAAVIRRTRRYVRILIVEAGGAIRTPPAKAESPVKLPVVSAEVLEGYRTTDGRRYAELSPQEQEMVVLARPDRFHDFVTGHARVRLAAWLAGRYTAGATVPELAGVIGRTTQLVRTLIVEGGATIPAPAPALKAVPAPVPAGFRTADGRLYAELSPEEQTMVTLSRPAGGKGHVMGEARTRLAGMLANRYQAGVSLHELAGLVNRSRPFVRALIAETGTPIRSRGRRPGM